MVAVILVVIAVAALPWWLPFLVRAVGRPHGVTIGDWETVGWRTIVYRDVVFERDGLRAQVDELRLPLLGVWPVPDAEAALSAVEVVLALTPTSPPPSGETPAPPSVPAIMRSLLAAWPQIEQWLPATAVNGLEIETGGLPIQIDRVSWDGTELSATGPIPGRAETFALALSRDGGTTLRLGVDAAAFEAHIDVVARLVDESVDATGRVSWRNNEAAVSAQFGATGLIPDAAAFDAPDLVVSAGDLGLTGYAPVAGSLHFDWTGDAYVAAVRAEARPETDAGSLPPLSVDVRATGDLNAVRADSAFIRLPGIEARLSSPLLIDVRTGVPRSAAAFSVEVDLRQMPWPIGTGQLSGRADVTAGESGAAPRVAFELSGNQISWRDVAISSLSLAGTWTREQLTLDRVAVQAGDDSTINGAASLDLPGQRIITATAQADLASGVVWPWLPAAPDFARLNLDVAASGNLSAPEHSGSLTLSRLAVRPDLAVDVAVSWEGAATSSGTGHGEITFDPEIRIPFSLAVGHSDDGMIAITCNELSWIDERGEWWRLSDSATISISPTDAETPPQIAVDALQVRGEGVSFDAAGEVQWPIAGRLELRSNGIDPSRLAFLALAADSGMRIDTMELNAAWNHGPVTLDGRARATYAPNESSAYAVETEFRTDGDDAAIGSLRVSDASGVVLEGQGELPLRLAGDSDGFRMVVPRDGALSLSLNSAPNPVFWNSVADLTGWRIQDPSVALTLAGSLEQPRGTMEFRAVQVHPPADLAAGQLPLLTDLHLVAAADDSGIALTTGVVAVEGRWVTLRGRIPWLAWDIWRAEHRVAWRRSEFSVASEPMPLTIVSQVMPTVLAPDGQMSFQMEHDPQRGFSGRLWLHQAATRPIPPLQTIRDIDGEITLDAYDLRLNRLVAYVGGRPIEITGAANISQRNAPVFDLHLTSTRVPLVRDQGVVLRASVDLDVEQTAGKPAHISGSATLGSSVFVSDLASLLPTGSVSAPEQRPPYFSVRDAPFADWTIDIAVHGDNFLRIENPFFRGTLSTDFRLEGTLAEPRAIGRVWSQAGSVVFPFGNMPIEQLEVTLTPENPYEPRLFVVGSARLYGYDIRMEATGSASEPRLSFSSDPPASSQQIFLFLTTGQIPDENRTFTTEERARRLAIFVGRTLARDFGIGGEGQEQLVIRSGEDFSREGGETYYVQYNLDGTWSLVGEYDRFDAYNGGIKYRLIDR